MTDRCQLHDNNITAPCTCTPLMVALREVKRLQSELDKFYVCEECDVAGHLDPAFRERLAKVWHKEGE